MDDASDRGYKGLRQQRLQTDCAWGGEDQLLQTQIRVPARAWAALGWLLGTGKGCCHPGMVWGVKCRVERRSKQDRDPPCSHPSLPETPQCPPGLLPSTSSSIPQDTPSASTCFTSHWPLPCSAHLHQENHSQTGPSSPLYPSASPEFGLDPACAAEQPQHCSSPNLLALPSAQLLLPILTPLLLPLYCPHP